MALDSESFNKDLYDLLKVRGYRPVPLDSKNQRVPASQAADVIEFTFTKDGEDYGKSWVSIDDASNVIVYYDEEQQESPSTTTPGAEYDDSWTGFLKHLKNWAQRRQLSFELSNKDRLGDDMRQRDYYKMKERVSESYHPMGKKASYNDAVPNVKIVLQHNRSLEEGEARFRNVAKIYLENVEGERFLAPTNKPGLARVYARHIAEGGVPNDEKWNHIKSVCEDYAKMAGFVRATRNGQFNESAQELVQEGINHYNSLRETLHKLSTHRGYQNYFESWSPPLMEDELDESINELFVQEMVDPRIESAMPILSRLKKPVSEMAEIDSLAEWADGIISEKLDLEEMGGDQHYSDTKGAWDLNVGKAKPIKVKDFAKKALKSLNRGMKGWEKGVHDVDTVKAATKSLSPDQKEKALSAKVGKGSPAELQQKLIKREKNKKVDEGTDSKLEAFLDQYPEAKDAMYNALRHFEYAYDAMDHVAGHVLHKIPYSEWEKVRQDFIDYFVSKGLKDDVNEDQINESYPSSIKQYAGDLARHMREEGYEWEQVDLSDPEEAISDAREQLSMFAESMMCDIFGDYDPTEQLQIIKMFNKKFGKIEEATGYYSEKHPKHDQMTKDGYEHSIEDILGDKLHRYFKPGVSLTDLYKYDDDGEASPREKARAQARTKKANLEVTDKGAVYINGTRITGRGTKWGVQNTVFQAKVPLDQVVQTLRDNGFGNIKLDPQYSMEMGIQLEEDLGPEQKRVGQLGPIGAPAKVGDLVGTNESTEFADELSRIIDIARFNR